MSKKIPVGNREVLIQTFGGVFIKGGMMVCAVYGGLFLAAHSIQYVGGVFLDRVTFDQFILSYVLVLGLLILFYAFWIYCLLEFLWRWLVLRKYRLVVGRTKKIRA